MSQHPTLQMVTLIGSGRLELLWEPALDSDTGKGLIYHVASLSDGHKPDLNDKLLEKFFKQKTRANLPQRDGSGGRPADRMQWNGARKKY